MINTRGNASEDDVKSLCSSQKRNKYVPCTSTLGICRPEVTEGGSYVSVTYQFGSDFAITDRYD